MRFLRGPVRGSYLLSTPTPILTLTFIGGMVVLNFFRTMNTAIGNWLTNGCVEDEAFRDAFSSPSPLKMGGAGSRLVLESPPVKGFGGGDKEGGYGGLDDHKGTDCMYGLYGYGGLDDPPSTPDITLLEGRLNKSQAEAGILRAEVAQAHLMNPGSNPEP